MNESTGCKTFRSALPDLLLDPEFAPAHPEMMGHLRRCAECRTEFLEMRSTFDLMDEWTAPEPSPYFDTKVHARLREAALQTPESFWERTRSFFLYSTRLQMRPALAGALGFVLLLGGGAAAGVYEYEATPVTQAVAPAVNDLKIMDNNAQALQQMDQLLDDSGSTTDQNSAPPTT